VTVTEDLPTPRQLQQRCAELFEAWRVLDTEVDVVWNARLSTTAGRAYVRRGCIELNPRLLARVPHEIDGVLIHEAAHVAAFRLFGANIPAHGRHWRSLMRIAGQEPNVTHTLPVDDLRRRPSRRFLYLRMCGSCGDRVVVEQVRYGRCPGCSRRDDYLVVKTRASAAGRRALQQMSDADVRAHFA
jgi:SprT protein